MDAMVEGFNVRVYGILHSLDRRQVLLIEETVFGKNLVKFPGGGVEAFEAPGVALVREFREELAVDIGLGPIFYVSPHFHRSFFRPQQLVGLYWEVHLKSGTLTAQQPNYRFMWEPIERFDVNKLTHPLDQEVAQVIVSKR